MKIRSKFIPLLPILVCVVGMVLMLEWAPYHTAQPAILSEPFPATNGYDDLVTAGQMVNGDPGNVDNLDLIGFRKSVAQDADALSRARLGLSRGCRVPLDFRAGASDHLKDLTAMKELALAFEAEGRLAQMENRPGDAARSYLDIIKLGLLSARGGTLLDQMDGTGIEALGTEYLGKVIGQLDAKSCQETAIALESLDAKKQPWQQVLLQERYWSLRTFPGIKYRLIDLFTAGQLKEARKHAETKFNEQTQRTRLLLITLAARAYQLEKGHAPATVDDLVPDYLKAVPQDPATGKPIAFSP